MLNENDIPHSLSLEERKSLYITGVDDVLNYNEENISVISSMGDLAVTGENLKIISLNTDTGELNIQGNISGLCYSKSRDKLTAFLGRLFK